MKAIRITLRDSERIKLEFPFNRDLIEKVKQMDDASWNHALKAWHIPFTRPVFLQLLNQFPDIDYDRESFEPLADRSKSLLPTHDGYRRKEIVFVSVVELNKESGFLLKPDPNPDLTEIVKQLPGVVWNQQMKGWIIANSSINLKVIFRAFKSKAWVDASQVFNRPEEAGVLPVKGKRKAIPAKEVLPLLSPENEGRITTFRDWLKSSRYSDSTVTTYTDGLKIFFRFCENRPPAEISNNDLIDFNNRYILKYSYSASYQNQVINAIKLYFRKIEDRKMDVEAIQRPRREHKLPDVLSKPEMEILLKAAAHNIKHQSMLSLIYSCGLRRSELINLKITDVDSKRGLLIIRNAKGKKDRVSPLSDKVVAMLRTYYLKHKPITYLFEGWKAGWKYSGRSLEEVLKKCLILAKIKKPVALHWLRHSYATHLLENGTDLRYIQEILGHKSSKTTEIYTHVSTKQLGQIKSPFDDLDL